MLGRLVFLFDIHPRLSNNMPRLGQGKCFPRSIFHKAHSHRCACLNCQLIQCNGSLSVFQLSLVLAWLIWACPLKFIQARISARTDLAQKRQSSRLAPHNQAPHMATAVCSALITRELASTSRLIRILTQRHRGYT